MKKNLCVNANSKQTHMRAHEHTLAPLQTCILCVFEGQPQSRRATTWNKSFVFSSYVPALFSRALPNRPITVSRIQVKYSTDTK